MASGSNRPVVTRPHPGPAVARPHPVDPASPQFRTPFHPTRVLMIFSQRSGLAMSDNGPQMRSHTTREFMAACAIMPLRPPVHAERPGLDRMAVLPCEGRVGGAVRIRDRGELTLELERARAEYNTLRLHAGSGYVTSDVEHHARGGQLRQQSRDGLATARATRLQYRRNRTK